MAKQHGERFVQLVEAVRGGIRECTVQDVKARQDRGEGFLLVDVREDHEWAAGHLPQATHLGKGIIERDIETTAPDPATEIVLYCGGGYRSALAADALQKMGYTNVISMDGGFRGWKEAGHSVVAG
ncbi:MAG: rhodanese-like domain-containing protein [Planctomycetaceae bacterium]|nr:rhodanese-like domain-containing protein [Planctomycetaceae bacterium]